MRGADCNLINSAPEIKMGIVNMRSIDRCQGKKKVKNKRSCTKTDGKSLSRSLNRKAICLSNALLKNCNPFEVGKRVCPALDDFQ